MTEPKDRLEREAREWADKPANDSLDAIERAYIAGYKDAHIKAERLAEVLGYIRHIAVLDEVKEIASKAIDEWYKG